MAEFLNRNQAKRFVWEWLDTTNNADKYYKDVQAFILPEGSQEALCIANRYPKKWTSECVCDGHTLP